MAAQSTDHWMIERGGVKYKLTTAEILTFVVAQSGFAESVQDIVDTMLQDSATITWTYNDADGTLTATAVGSGGGGLSESAVNARTFLRC